MLYFKCINKYHLCYFDLTKFGHNFINKNYPLSKEDFECLASKRKDEDSQIELTDNLKNRQELDVIIKSEIKNILEKQAQENIQFLKDLEGKKDVKAINIEQYKQQILNYEQQILEKVWQFRNGSKLIDSALTQSNKESIRQSIEEGISAEAVNSTIADILNKTDEIRKTPRHVKGAIETIVHMKKDVNNIPDKTYASNFVRENNEKIKAAINDGISPNEIATTLLESTEKANDRRTKRRLKFITKLIVKMKQKELKLLKQNEQTIEKGIQKVFTK